MSILQNNRLPSLNLFKGHFSLDNYQQTKKHNIVPAFHTRHCISYFVSQNNTFLLLMFNNTIDFSVCNKTLDL